MLLDESVTVRQRLMQLETLKAGVAEARELSAKADELTVLSAKVQKLAVRNQLLNEHRVARAASLETATVLQSIDLCSQRFSESPKSSTLVGGQRWSKMVTALGSFSVAADTLQKQDWVKHFESKLFAGVPPEQRKQTIVQTMPENITAIRNYTQWYQRLIKYRNFVPASAEDFDDVQSCSDQLAAITFKENDDVPGPVKAFFNATSSGSGAGLDFLTAEVVEWLRTNHMLTNYVVRAR